MSVKLVDPMPLHPSLCYPGTRQPLRAVCLRADGTVVWPLTGGDGEGEGEEGATDDDGEMEEAEEETEEGESTEESKKAKPKKTGPVSREEFDAVTKRLSAADRRRSEAEQKASTLQKEKDDRERKDKPEVENLRKDLAAVTENHGTLQKRFNKLALENAFHTASAQAKVSWQDPKVAMRAADLDDLEIDEKGNVDGILEAVKLLAKQHKYLVNTGKESDDEEEDQQKVTRRGASGASVGSAKTAKAKPVKGQISDADLKKRFPALKTR